MHYLSLLALLAFFMATITVDGRAHYHRKRALQEDYEYRDTSDYSDNTGVFVDSVPIKTTPGAKGKHHQRTNRFPKLRKFFEDRYFQ